MELKNLAQKRCWLEVLALGGKVLVIVGAYIYLYHLPLPTAPTNPLTFVI